MSLKNQIKILSGNIRRVFLLNKTFSIISNNCWGGFISQYFNLKYNSPFIGLFLFPKDYIKLLKDLKKYMDMEIKLIDPLETKYKNTLIEFKTYGKYPIGKLDDIEIHFFHYKTNEEALKKWNERKKRINYDNLIVKFCDRDSATVEDIKNFAELNYKNKVLITAKQYPYSCCVKLKNENGEFVEKEWRNFKKTVNVVKFMNKFSNEIE